MKSLLVNIGLASVALIIALAIFISIANPIIPALAAWMAVESIVDVFYDSGSDSAPLNLAVIDGNIAQFELLAKNRKERKLARFPKLTAKLAAMNGRVAILEILEKKYGWDVNSPIYPGSPNTAIDYAVESLNAPAVHYLISRGAVLHTYRQLGEVSVLASVCNLRKNDKDSKESKENAIQIAKLLIAAGEPARAPDLERGNPLYMAIRSNFPEMVSLLLDNGASPTEGSSKTVGTPIEYAMFHHCLECIAPLEAAIAKNR